MRYPIYLHGGYNVDIVDLLPAHSDRPHDLEQPFGHIGVVFCYVVLAREQLDFCAKGSSRRLLSKDLWPR